MSDEEALKQAIERYADMVRRICLLHLKNYHDTEDVFQTVFYKYLIHEGAFENEAHERAWFAKVSMNACKDLVKSWFRKNKVSFEELSEMQTPEKSERSDIMQAVCSLPDKYKQCIYLFYYEGYSAVEIASILGKNENTVYSLLARARTQLKAILGGDYFEQ